MSPTVDLGRISVKQLIAHNIPRRKANDDSKINLSQAPPMLGKDVLDFFTNKLKGTLSRNGQRVVPSSAVQLPHTFHAILEGWLAGELTLFEVSVKAAELLFNVQTGSASLGLLAICEVDTHLGPALGVLKLPQENGLQVTDATDKNGRRTLRIEVLSDLTLTQNTRVFKAGLFWENGTRWEGRVSDDQTGSPTAVADFFLHQFLGCTFKDLPHILTLKFRDAVVEYTSYRVADPERKHRYYNALSTELLSNAPKIDPELFVRTHFDVDDQDGLYEALEEEEVPLTPFLKSLEAIPNRARNGRMGTAHGITILGTFDALERVRTGVDADGEPIIVIADRLTDVK